MSTIRIMNNVTVLKSIITSKAAEGTMTTKGVIRIGEKRISYWLAAQNEPAESGIDGGKITRLTMKLDNKWDYKFEDGAVTLQTESVETRRALEMLVLAYN